jgi:single-stranded DNA-binding protein
MSMNVVVIEGRFPHFDPTYTKGEGEKRSFLRWAVSVKRDFKPEGEKYYPEDLVTVKGFGPRMDAIMKNFSQGDGISIKGRIQKDDDYEKDGETKRGEFYVLIEDWWFTEGNARKDAAESSGDKPASSSKPAAKAGAKTPGINPLGAKKPGGKSPF